MSPEAEKKRDALLKNKNFIKPRFCRNSKTSYCICKGVLECALIDCSEGSVEAWE